MNYLLFMHIFLLITTINTTIFLSTKLISIKSSSKISCLASIHNSGVQIGNLKWLTTITLSIFKNLKRQLLAWLLSLREHAQRWKSTRLQLEPISQTFNGRIVCGVNVECKPFWSRGVLFCRNVGNKTFSEIHIVSRDYCKLREKIVVAEQAELLSTVQNQGESGCDFLGRLL